MKLFSEFPEISTQQWEDLILKDLKGGDYSKKLVWNTDEGFSVNPYYRANDLKKPIPNPPGFPLDWNLIEEISSPSPEDALSHIQDGVLNDATGFRIVSIWNEDEIYGVELASLEKIQNFMESILDTFSSHTSKTFRLYWDTSSSSPAYQKAWTNAKKKFPNVSASSYFFQDPLSALTVCGEFYNSERKTWSYLLESLQDSFQDSSIAGAISVNAINIAHWGGNISQELAYALAMGTEYINQLVRLGETPENISGKITFRFAVGSQYFLEIAKFRAFRFLWNQVLEAYNIPNANRSCHILAETTEWNSSLYDPYVNMLRVTTEAMSAILGGTDSLLVHPFDRSYSTGDGFSRRISRNVQHLLRHESYFDKVQDPSCGSYYLEILTENLGKSAWELFQTTDKDGGYIESFRKGNIQKSIESILTKRVTDQLTKKSILLGVSQYPNPQDRLPEDKRLLPRKSGKSPFPEYSGKPDFQTDYLKTRRAALEFEELRKSVENKAKETGKFPTVYLLLTGHKAMRTARAGFATNFFGVVGAEIINPGGTENPSERMEEIQSIKPDYLVFCSSDEEYLTTIKSLLPSLKEASPHTKFYVAGKPSEEKEIQELGIQGFIHAKSPLYQTLKEIFS